MLTRILLFSLLTLLPEISAARSSAHRAPPVQSSVVLNQGEVARWPGVSARSCLLSGKKYPPVEGVCYYPFDVEARPGRYAIGLIDRNGRHHKSFAIVNEFARPRIDVTLPDDTYINVTPENQKRARQEREIVMKLFARKATEPLFMLPLGAPASPLPRTENNFGSLRVFNGVVESRHVGRDYPVNEGSPVHAIADGTVLIADEHFLTGNSVYIDHGDGLVSASFHLSEIDVQQGGQVRRGDVIGKVGATGRASGAHLHLGIRWLGARVDPEPLLHKALQLHDVGETPAQGERKDNKAFSETPESSSPSARDDEG
jgi:hypothetical protein